MFRPFFTYAGIAGALLRRDTFFGKNRMQNRLLRDIMSPDPQKRLRTMKKKILIAGVGILAVLLIVLAVLGASYGKITVVSGAQYVQECPRYARSGREVTVLTAVVCDAEIYVNGADGKYVRPGEYVFTMPDGDVQLSVTVIAYPDGA